jgi:hypothetical protein
MPKRMDISGANSCRLRIVGKKILYPTFLSWPLPSGKQVGRNIPSHSQVRTQKFRRVSPQGFLSANAIFKTPYPDTVIF